MAQQERLRVAELCAQIEKLPEDIRMAQVRNPARAGQKQIQLWQAKEQLARYREEAENIAMMMGAPMGGYGMPPPGFAPPGYGMPPQAYGMPPVPSGIGNKPQGGAPPVQPVPQQVSLQSQQGDASWPHATQPVLAALPAPTGGALGTSAPSVPQHNQLDLMAQINATIQASMAPMAYQMTQMHRALMTMQQSPIVGPGGGGPGRGRARVAHTVPEDKLPPVHESARRARVRG